MNTKFASVTLALLTSFAGATFCQEPPPPPDKEQPGPPRGHREHMRAGGPKQYFHSLTPEQQQQFLKLLDEWSKLTPEQRQDILSKSEQNPEKRDQLRRSLEPFEQMPPEQRKRVHDRIRDWQQMPTEEREKFRQREQELRQKAEQELAERLNELDIKPEPEQMRWIRQFYFQKKREIGRKVGQRARELKGQRSPETPDGEKQKLRQQVQAYRQELEQEAKREFEEFARNPHRLAPQEFHAEGPRGGRQFGPEGRPDRPGRPQGPPPEGGHGPPAPRPPGPPPDDSL